jgi:hypothetical protein
MYEPFQVVEVLLDEENPRFADPVRSQPEAINALLRLGEAKLLNLAEDIAVTSQLDPTNPPSVTRQNGEAVVREGNRRFAALKLLRNPDLAAGESARRALARIRAKAEAAGKDPNGPSEVTCWVPNDGDETRRWIELRHTGQNEGVGTDPWNSYQSVTYRRRPGTPEDLAWLLVRAIIATFDADQSLVSDVRTVRDEKFTNLARLLGREHVREQMPVTFDGDDVLIRSDDPFTVDLFRTVFSDLKTMTVDAIKTGELQDEYIDAVVAAVRERYPEQQASDSEAAEDDGAGRNGSDAGADSSRTTTNGSSAGTSGVTSTTVPTRRRNPPRGEAKIFHGLILRNVELRTSTLLRDAQTVKIETAPAVCAAMVRLVLELARTDGGVRRGWFVENAKLRTKFRKCLLALDPQAEKTMSRDKSLEMAWIKTQSGDGDGLAVDEMNAYIHNFMADPTPASVRGLTSIFRPFLQRLDDYAGENPVA